MRNLTSLSTSNVHSSFDLVGVLSFVSVVLTVVIIYLSINKVWIRKHEQEVADSVSVFATLLALFQSIIGLLVALLNFSFDDSLLGVIWVIVGIAYLFIALGLWVNNGLTFRHKVMRALKMERTESSAMLKNLIQNVSIEKVYRIICTLALADRELQKEEVKLLKEFANNYNVDYENIINSISKDIEKESSTDIINNLKNDIQSYINTSPPKHVVVWLHDLIEKIVKADGRVSEEESIISEEISGAITTYLSDGKIKAPKYYLILLPQDKSDEESILRVNHNLVKSEESIFGSKMAYIIDSFYSQKFAEIIREDYVRLYKCAVTIEKL